MVSSADRAREKAEARRLRILSRSAERLDVVNGLQLTVPLSTPSVASKSAVDVPPVVVDDAAAAAGENRESTTEPPTTSDDQEGGYDAAAATALSGQRPSAGARRMAAMRKRRYKSKSKVGEEVKEEESNVEAATSGGAKEEEKAEVKKDENVAEKDDDKVVEKSEPALVEVEAKELTAPIDRKEDKENVRVAATSNTPVEEKKEEEPKKPKKYMGVARMRRKILKEQKAQRLKDIADSEVMDSSKKYGDLERELAAEMDTMNITVSQVRKGGMGMGVDGSKASLSSVAMKKGLKKSWFSVLVPPMKLMPRLVTLLLLFFAGLDLGSQPHRGGISPLDIGVGVAPRELSSAGVGLIHHVELSLTKPWEYGMGGKVAFMVGMAPSSPPTAMPTSFNDAGMVCTAAAGEDAMEECLATPKQDKTKDGAKADKGKKKKKSTKLQLMEDENVDPLFQFDSSRTRPRGVSHDDEFDDTIPTGKSNNVDPLFKVDLDALLENAQLPLPMDFAAKVAIGFHRTWVYYLWTLPTSLMKSMLHLPKNVLSGWISNPPWILGVALLIRLIAKILAGNGKSFSSDSEKNDSIGGSGKGGGGSKNLDMLGTVMDTAKNYATGKFPKTALVLGTLMKVMKVDMYVLLCGLLVGLVVPSVKEDYLGWSGSSADVEGGMSRPVLGDGEL
mmetsp:Transcript_20657/g.37312  ORF Transcript_20657/g.37312 Transcript_20657/m.37312 type:complete len:674 (-) Transcript_20657:162-2183(-)